MVGLAGGDEAAPAELPEVPTLDDYLRVAELNNPGLEAAFHRWQAALARVPQATSLPDARFTYRYFIEEVETRVGPQRQAFGISQTFPWFGKLSLRGKMAAEAAEAARQRYRLQRLRLRRDVAQAYHELAYLASSIRVVKETRALLVQLEAVARSSYRAGVAQYSDVMRAQVELGKIEDRLRRMEDMRGPAIAKLNAALNRPADLPLPWPEPCDAQEVTLDERQLLHGLRASNPELLAMEHAIAREEYAIALARKGPLPDVTLGLDYIDTSSARMSGVPDSGKDPVSAMVSVNIPLWQAKYRAAEREALAQRSAASSSRAERENQLAAEVAMVLYELRDARRRIGFYRDTLVPKAEQSLRATETAFRAGTANFVDLVDAERTLLEFGLAYERARADHGQRLADLEALVGQAMPQAGEDSAEGAGAKDAEVEE